MKKYIYILERKEKQRNSVRELEIKRKNSVREMKIKISDARICVIKILERNWRVGSQKLEEEIKSLRESEAENN